MLILGIETSLPRGFVFLGEEKQIINYRELPPRACSGHLVPAIKSMLDETKVSITKVKAVVVTTGPGSFTGVRVGVSLAKSLSFCLKLPLIGIPTLDCIAFSTFFSGIICSLIQGYGGCYFAAFFEKEKKEIRKIGEYLFLPVDEIINLARKFLPQKVTFIPSEETYFPTINQNNDKFYLSRENIKLEKTMFKLALERIRSANIDDPLTLVPVYVSAPRIKRGEKWKIW